MAKATVLEPPVSPPSEGTPDTAPNGLAPVVAAPVGAPLPEGFRRLSDARRSAAPDQYAVLKALVGQTIQLDEVSISADFKTGSMAFSLFGVEDSETFKSPIPKGALKAIAAAARQNPDETIVADVVQTKRGVALR